MRTRRGGDVNEVEVKGRAPYKEAATRSFCPGVEGDKRELVELCDRCSTGWNCIVCTVPSRPVLSPRPVVGRVPLQLVLSWYMRSRSGEIIG